ncbi:unnamed protein product [Ceutorhynchus assimilis]|uniref:Uncharacterized protein n=1 Tax=Ceutorhynchus assimilis TaxID=467358 RepID=A0A9N9MMZ2_9CUCU|nr:unnamed protein product [Ceutorhynchus assimilis]
MLISHYFSQNLILKASIFLHQKSFYANPLTVQSAVCAKSPIKGSSVKFVVSFNKPIREKKNPLYPCTK